MITSYRDLIVWQKGMTLTEKVYLLTKQFPSDERYALISQIRRSAASIPANIAEGRHRGTRKDFRQFLIIARGSCAELQTHVDLATRLHYCTIDNTKDVMVLIEEISRMLLSIVRKLTQPKAHSFKPKA